jgi:hypothetical protein
LAVVLAYLVLGSRADAAVFVADAMGSNCAAVQAGDALHDVGCEDVVVDNASSEIVVDDGVVAAAESRMRIGATAV